MTDKKLLLVLFSLSLGVVNQGFAEDKKNGKEVEVVVKSKSDFATRSLELVEPEDRKNPLCLEAGDTKLTFGGSTKIEHFFTRNQVLLNKNIPDEANFFKHTLALTFDFAYGEKKFGHKALELFTDIRHKGVWGRGTTFADSTDGTTPAQVQISRSFLKKHSHTTGKPLIYFNQGWLQFSFNAICNSDCENRHFLKLGWFPFQLGRGIALGGYYGVGRSSLSFYSYGDDKSAPGINLHGDILKDQLSYDLYYAKFQSRSKGFDDTFNTVKEQLVGRKATPWRGVGKDNDLIAGRLKWKPVDSDSYGKLELEPYAFYNAASDQSTNKISNNTSIKFGSFGLGVEHTIGGFEWGVEAAANYGYQSIKASDKNAVVVVRDDTNGYLREQFTYVVDAFGNPVPVNPASSAAAAKEITGVVNANTIIPGTIFYSKKDRIIPAYKNDFRGWMAVADLAYNFKDYDLTLAAAYGFASGDKDPNENPVNSTYKGFVGVHECYSGKRVSSVILLDERSLRIPVPLNEGADEAEEDFAFTDLQHVGLGLTWSPKLASKNFSFNPNILAFWKTNTGKKFDVDSGKTTNEDASRFMGTEYNLFAECELLKNFKMYGVFAAFVPGTYFKDVAGIPFDGDLIDGLGKNNVVDTDAIDPTPFRLSDNTAYHLNIGFEYKF